MTLSPDATRTRRATAAIATVDLRVAAAIAGDAAALESLVRDYRPRIFRYARARLRDDATADDVTQEVCMALIRALPTHRFRRYSLAAFIFGITANKVAMSHRAHYRRRRREQPVGLAPECADDALDPAQRAEQAETRAYVTALLEHLPPASRHLLTLRLAVGLSAEGDRQGAGHERRRGARGPAQGAADAAHPRRRPPALSTCAPLAGTSRSARQRRAGRLAPWTGPDLGPGRYLAGDRA